MGKTAPGDPGGARPDRSLRPWRLVRGSGAGCHRRFPGSRHRAGAAYSRIRRTIRKFSSLLSCATSICCWCWTISSSLAGRKRCCCRSCWPRRTQGQAAGDLAHRLNLREEWLAPLEGLETPGSLDHEDTKETHNGAGEEHEARSDARRDTNLRILRTSWTSCHFATSRSNPPPRTLQRHRLILACMRRLRPDFQPTEEDVQHIIRICRLLDGMPLAIELAAARIRAMPLEKIDHELEHGLQLLATKIARCARTPAQHDRRVRPLMAAARRSSAASCASFRSFAAAARPMRRRQWPARRSSDLEELVDASWMRLGAEAAARGCTSSRGSTALKSCRPNTRAKPA